MNKHNLNYFAVIMAGGVGSRFWPVSKAKYPKQFHDMMGVGETLIQLTYNRISTIVPPQNILILTNEAYKDLVKEQLPKIKDEQIVLEPAMRNTAPCILLAALKIKKQNPDGVMLVAPSDHWINDKEAFVQDIHTAFEEAAKTDILITLGIKPTNPNTGFGYIKFDEEDENFHIKKVSSFTEKPTLRNAKKYLEEGNYLWNAGIFIWKAAVIAEAFSTYREEMFKLFDKGNDTLNSSKEEAFIKEIYPEAQNISIDYAILEKSNKVFVIPAGFDWDDLGTWGALYNQLGKDEDKNVVINAHLLPNESGKNIIYTHSHKVVVLDGLEDYIIVDDKDVLLIVPREKEQEIKEIRMKVLEKYGNNLE
ncbi:mannose-1-phosphate guanylyltransferase [Antarcticibacterium flavum]|uniref:mannose-1-phosphate guanylyltransferase n=1 Tax=Antarcticibacterium flavum TaxID=2058175 RepID=A0A5B7X116_9FLAO|nr:MULTISPECIES: mannose-1-phosphate guanylyltransferase [Antarcticibacterium]MCM4160485.1 mannose-1-phosphate guanylyltransferase [Antarcticibacterium sp. W02-3]QCY69226.1 mannose-1-phosphate guanylyltransferase [Antarcticibacterium flavum]